MLNLTDKQEAFYRWLWERVKVSQRPIATPWKDFSRFLNDVATVRPPYALVLGQKKFSGNLFGPHNFQWYPPDFCRDPKKKALWEQFWDLNDGQISPSADCQDLIADNESAEHRSFNDFVKASAV